MLHFTKIIPLHLVLTLMAASSFPANAAVSQTQKNIINIPPPYAPFPSASLPTSVDSRTNEQTKTSKPQQPDVLDRIMSTDPDTIEIKQENRSDLSTCDATEGEAMLVALYNCWPVLEGFQTYFAAKKIAQYYRTARGELVLENPDYRNSIEYEGSQQAEYEDTTRLAKKIENLAEGRDYPMQDMLLFLANIMQIAVAQKKEDYETALAHLDNSIMIFETTRITEPEFAKLSVLKKQREQMAERVRQQGE